MLIYGDTQYPTLTVPSLEQSKQKLRLIPGGTDVIDGKRIDEGTKFTVGDALAYSPGVFVGDSQASVAGGSRISIRGSDINTAFVPISGIKFLRDGMPFTNANGFTDTESLNLNAIHHIEVYRGANALEYGASNLGGAINLIPPTGHSAKPLKIGMVFGSDGYLNPTVSAGVAMENGWDAYGSFSYLNFDGNRDNSDQELYYGYGNIGYRWNANHETRLHFDVQDIKFLLPFSLTKEQVHENPRQSLASPGEKPSGFSLYRVDLQHTVRFDQGELDLAAYYFVKDNLYSFQHIGFLEDLWQDAGFTWRHQIDNTFFGLNNRIIWGGLVQWMWINDKEYQPVDGQPGSIYFHEKDLWNNVEAYIEDRLNITHDFMLILGAQINYRRVEIERLIPDLDEGKSNPAHQDYFNFNPKLGFIWQAVPTAQVFGNVSRSSEPPPINNYEDLIQEPELSSQTGTTIELGTRGSYRGLLWDLALYHTWLKNELLTVPTPPNFINFETGNADNTTHTGIELGLEYHFPLQLIATDDRLRLRGSYTWSRFRFDNDPQLGNNTLPGVPEHYGRFEVLYQHPNGIYFGPNLTAASSTWVDFTNTLSADSYALLGFRLGWDDSKHWHIYLDGRNLTNEFYTASVFVTGDAENVDPFGRGTILFNPGATRMVFAGIEYRF